MRLPLITGVKAPFQRGQSLFLQKQLNELRVNPTGPPPSQLMLTELMGRAASEAGSPGQSEWFQERGLGRGTDMARLGGLSLARTPRAGEASAGPTWPTGQAQGKARQRGRC